ncbi:type III PLP-dependent enzyme [Aestuariivirga litoralis]|uniref:type III PLP-dependent enzyme n=1 Tax=Aestuariivirga litoralis TaxID=2650924 RepID=UPI0018C4B44E|nr:type III PLP-dependent enzyme [Aestuariivirga litoralis]MBG1231434.1 type III PLP-dependent enzyme [Aestuariivirga litoralis]
MTEPAIALKTSNTSAPKDAGELSLQLDGETAVFCFSADALTARAKLFNTGFKGLVTFAVKSNPSREVASTLAAAGLKAWDVASVQEMELVSGIQKDARFHYHNPIKSLREITRAYNEFNCRRFCIDCKEELAKIVSVAGSDRNIEIAVRIVLPRDRGASAHDFSTKFGAPEHIALELLKKVKALGFTPLITFHPGSQTKDPQVYARHIEAAARISKQADVEITKLNVGGGFPADYEYSKAPEPDVYFRAIEIARDQHFAGRTLPALECEPGRGLVAGCMSLLTNVKLVCSDGDDIFINDGVYGGLMEYMQVPELKPPTRVIRKGKVHNGQVKSWKVFGPTCDPLDVLPHRLDLSADLKDGDFIEFGMLGAYGISTLTKFNGYGQNLVMPVGKVLQS